MTPAASCAHCGARLPAGARTCPVCGAARGSGQLWRRMSVRARSTLIGFILALAILGTAVLFVLSRERPLTEGSGVRVTSDR